MKADKINGLNVIQHLIDLYTQQFKPESHKIKSYSLLECRAVMLPRCETC